MNREFLRRDVSLWKVSPTRGLAIYTAPYYNVGNRTGVQEIDGTWVTYGTMRATSSSASSGLA